MRQCCGPPCSTLLIVHVVGLQSSAARSGVSRVGPRSPPSGESGACSAFKMGLQNKPVHGLPLTLHSKALWEIDNADVVLSSCVGLLSLAIILILSSLKGCFFLRECAQSHRDSRPWSCEAGIDVAPTVFLPGQRQHCSCFRTDSCVQVRGFAPGALILLCPPTQVFYCSHEKRPLRWRPGNLSVICRGDCDHVGRAG